MTGFLRLILFTALAGAFVPNVNAGEAPRSVDLGRAIYEEGVLPSGAPLRGQRFDNTMVEGKDAACINCHRKSGMGGVEGTTVMPPVGARFLFHRDQNPIAIIDPRIRMGFTIPHDSYTPESLLKALRAGERVGGGNPLDPVMPRYELDDASAKALQAYLAQLSDKVSPGVEDDRIHFAVVFGPEVDERLRKTLTEGIQNYFRRHDDVIKPGVRHHQASYEVFPRTPRKWELSVWRLTGPESGWPAQLKRFYKSQPVFAVVGGMATSASHPVDAFCEAEKIPCLFRTDDLPPGRESRYNFYFSSGVSLESQVLLKYWAEHPERQANGRLIQIVHDDFVGRQASKELEAAAKGTGQVVLTRVVGKNDRAGLRQAFQDVRPEDRVVNWLRPDAIGLLAEIPPPEGDVYFSTFMAGGEQAPFPDAWKAKSRLIYPFELPDKRVGQLAVFYAWMTTNHVPPLNERIQSEMFFNMLLLSESLGQMLDNLHREYLVEVVERVIGMGFQRSMYPKLSLGPNQRFAARAGYIAHWEKDGKLVADTDRLAP